MEAAAEPRQLEFLRRKDRERGFSRFRESSCALTLCSESVPPPLSQCCPLTRGQENRTLQPASANYGTRRYHQQQGARRKDRGRSRKREEGRKGREERVCVVREGSKRRRARRRVSRRRGREKEEEVGGKRSGRREKGGRGGGKRGGEGRGGEDC